MLSAIEELINDERFSCFLVVSSDSTNRSNTCDTVGFQNQSSLFLRDLNQQLANELQRPLTEGTSDKNQQKDLWCKYLYVSLPSLSSDMDLYVYIE